MYLNRKLILCMAGLLSAGWAVPAMAAPFDVEAATRLWLDTVDGPARARSDAYFEGRTWLIAWGALLTMAVDALILRLRLSALLRDHAFAFTRRVWLRDWLTGAGYVAVAMALMLPWQFYTGFVRERHYGLSNQSLADWLGDMAITVGVALAFLPLLIVFVYSAIRRFARYWWLAGGVVYTGLMAGLMLLAPVFINPLLNTYSELPEGPLRERIEAMAEAHGVPADHILVYDASHQTNRISANVSGLGPTIRISLNDNLLERTSEAEIMAVMGHELGHYVLDHPWRLSLGFGLLAAVALFFAGRIARRLVARFGPRAGVNGLADPASLPMLGIGIAVVSLLATPFENLLVRWNESAADAFGLEAAREPDGFARVSMRLAEYRKLEPSRLEEWLFHDHPSGATRVRMAMEWKAKNMTTTAVPQP